MRANPRPKRVVAQNVKNAAQNLLGGPPSSAELFDPADSTAAATSHAALKEWAEAGRQAALALSKKAELNSVNEALELVTKKFTSVYSQAISAQQPTSEILADFEEWKGNEGYEAWPLFEKGQKGISVKAKEKKAAQDQAKVAADCISRAQGRALAKRDLYPAGPDGDVGTVCSGLADATGAWGGTSGHHGTLHAVMEELLSSVQKVEKWPPRVCGEVQAMNKYLNARNIQSIKDIPKGSLYSHAETWKWPDAKSEKLGLNGKWISRGACDNCKQWLDRIEANYC
jgi:hypothetical protein